MHGYGAIIVEGMVRAERDHSEALVGVDDDAPAIVSLRVPALQCHGFGKINGQGHLSQIDDGRVLSPSQQTGAIRGTHVDLPTVYDLSSIADDSNHD